MALGALLARSARRTGAAWLVCLVPGALGCSGEVVNLGSSGLQASGGGSNVPRGTWGVPSSPLFAQKAGILLANPTLTQGMDELYYSVQERGGNLDPNPPHVERALWDGTAWSNFAEQTLGDLMAPDVSSPAVSADGTQLWLGMNSNGSTDIFECTRKADAWTTPVPVAELNSVKDDAPRPPAVAGTIMPLSSKRHGGPLYQIYLSTRETADAVWGEPSKALLGTVDSDAFQSADGFLDSSGLELYFSSTRASDHADSDLYVARRERLDAAFGEPEALSDLNDPLARSEERMPWLSSDGTRLYFVSDRSGQYTLYLATKLQ